MKIFFWAKYVKKKECRCTRMSSFSGRQAKGNASADAFYTQPNLIRCLVQHNADIFSKASLIVDASAGDGKFAEILCKEFKGSSRFIYQSDIDPKGDNVQKLDALTMQCKDIDNRKGGVYGFNPPFGYMCGLARKMILHAIKIQEPEFICVILPSASGSRLIFPGYKKIRREVLERGAFYDPNTMRPFTFETAFFIWQRQADGSSDIIERVLNESPFVTRIIGRYDDAKLPATGEILVVRRVGASCGKNGYIRYQGVWYGYRFGVIDWNTIIQIPASNVNFLTILLNSVDKKRIGQMTRALCAGRQGFKTFNICSSYCAKILNNFKI